MKISTVNVIEYFDDTVQQLSAFTDDADGNKMAEKLFVELAKENLFSVEEIEVGLDDGMCLNRDGYSIFITHSDSPF